MNSYDADKRVFGITHNQVGAILLDYWNLPKEVVVAVARHHRRTDTDTLMQILQLAEILEGSDPTAPHDPNIDALVPIWQEKLLESGAFPIVEQKP
jgi:HD-like signal output (HDOD) protein